MVGGAIEVRVAAHPDKIFSGQVKRLGASIKAATRTMPVEAEIPNSDRLLKPGFFARGTVQLAGELQPVLLVPKAALVATTGGSRVFVRSGDKVEERLLATGASRGDLVEVTGRLSPGDEIAIENVSALADGVAIAK
jgi:multidrug efflux pump subunit AcrA (membrane-fusion protein)